MDEEILFKQMSHTINVPSIECLVIIYHRYTTFVYLSLLYHHIVCELLRITNMAWINPNDRLFDLEREKHSGKPPTQPTYSPTPIALEDPSLKAYRKQNSPPQLFPSPSPLVSVPAEHPAEQELRQLRQWTKGFFLSMSAKFSLVRAEIDTAETHINEARIRFRKLQDELEQIRKHIIEDGY